MRKTSVLPVLVVVGIAVSGLMAPGSTPAADPVPRPPLQLSLTPAERAEGWVQLFDGESTFGWTGAASVKDGLLEITGDKLVYTLPLPAGQVRIHATGALSLPPEVVKAKATPKGLETEATLLHASGRTLTLAAMPPGTRIRTIIYKPAETRSLFNGKDLTGWTVYTGDPKRELSKFRVTEAGELAVTNGPGDLQTEAVYDDFLLHLECKTNGPALNSGIFFRCLPKNYQAGYEAQIQNAIINGDRTKPVDYGTGAIYRRIPARKVMANDNEWFTMTIVARRDRIATWVNGYPVVNWKDDRPANDNARQGLKTGPGAISIQGHDPTTDILFRNLRISLYK